MVPNKLCRLAVTPVPFGFHFSPSACLDGEQAGKGAIAAMQPGFSDSHQQNMRSGLPPCPSFPGQKETARRRAGFSSPSHLYLRGCLYYFRYKFPRHVCSRLGHAEFRMGLRTGYVRWAKYLAAHLHAALQTIISGDSLLNYNEICRRMNILMQQLLEDALAKNYWPS